MRSYWYVLQRILTSLVRFFNTVYVVNFTNKILNQKLINFTRTKFKHRFIYCHDPLHKLIIFIGEILQYEVINFTPMILQQKGYATA
jgi:hypothetical protein